MTRDEMKEAAEMWARGERITDIGAAFGLDKPAITALAYSNREMFPARLPGTYRASNSSAAGIANRAAARARPVKERFPQKAEGFDGVPRRSLMKCHCEFPLWGDHERFDIEISLFCGAPASMTSPYCTFHAKKVAGSGTRSERDAVASALAAA